MTAAAIYTRVSTEMQVDGFSLDAQLTACQELAQRRGLNVVEIFTDKGLSAKTVKRPQLQAMLQAARARRFNVIIFHKLDRLSRSVRDTLNILSDLETLGIEILAVQDNFDRSTPAGKFSFNLMAAFAEMYSQNLAFETRKGKEARAKSGFWSGGDVPFGYTTSYKKDGGDNMAYPHPTNAAGVVMAFEQYATGRYSDYDIAEMLNQAGYRPKGRGSRAQPLFTKDTITCLLKNRFYVGEVHYRDQLYPGRHEPIISHDLFERAQIIRRERRSNHNTKTRQNGKVYILAGLAYCARCKSRLRGYNSNGYRYYQDPARDHMVECDQLLIRADKAEAAIGDYLRLLKLPADWRERVLNLLQGEADRADDLHKEQAALTGQLERWKKLFAFGDITEGEYLAQRRQLQSRLKGLKPSVLPDLERAAALLGDFGKIWDNATLEERKEIAQTLLHSVYLNNGESGPIVAIEPKPQFSKLFEIFTLDSSLVPVAPAYNVSIALPGYYAPVLACLE